MQPNYSYRDYSSLAKTGKALLESHVKPFYLQHQTPSNQFPRNYPRIVNVSMDPTALIHKLTLKRLRKMQALVRGFLVRRITYPRLLKRYRICQKVYQSILSGCILDQSSQIVLELVSQNQNSRQFSYQSKDERLAGDITNKILETLTEAMSKQVIATCITQDINKRQPAIKVLVAQNKNMYRLDVAEQRVAQQVINKYIDRIRENMAKEIIKETVEELRIEKIAQEYILNKKLLPLIIEGVYKEYVNQIVLEELSERVIDDALEEFSRTLVKYETKHHQTRVEEMGIKESQTALFHLIMGEEILEMISRQQYVNE